MRAKSLLLLVIALGCGMIAAVAVSKTVMKPNEGPAPEASVEIFVAVKDLQTTQQITAENVKLEKWPRNRIPEDSVSELSLLEGKFLKQSIFANEPILLKKLADTRESFATSIPPGYRVFDIACNSGYIKPGDHVDIIGTFRLQGKNSTPETRPVMRNIMVCGINGITTRDSEALEQVNGKSSTFQLLVRDSQLQALTTANTLGELHLNLRPLNEAKDDETSDNGDMFLNWLAQSEESAADVSGRAQPVMSSLESMLGGMRAQVAAPPKKQMQIITPEGVSTYEWSDDRQLPKLVEEPGAVLQPTGYAGGTGNPWQSSDNVYSGYGGYPPTYPTSTAPPTPPVAPTEPVTVETGARTVN